jgi:hypothetical protein
LTIYPDKPVVIVESEKSAIIASALIPNLIWLVAGNINGLSVEKCKVLKIRNVILYSDLGVYEKWSLKATEIRKAIKCKISKSTLLEDIATGTNRINGLDIAYYMIVEIFLKKTIPQIQSCFSSALHSLIEKK